MSTLLDKVAPKESTLLALGETIVSSQSEQATQEEIKDKSTQKEYKIYQVDQYNKRKDKEGGEYKGCVIKEGTIEMIAKILQEDHYYHLRLNKDDDVMFFGDLDGYPGSIDEFKSKLGAYLTSKGYATDMESSFRYTQNKKYVSKTTPDGKSYHFTVLTLYASMDVMSKMMKEFMKAYNCPYIDTSVYGDKWWRLPGQKKGKKSPSDNTEGTEHEIIKGDMVDFVVTHIQEGSKRVEWKETAKKNVKIDKKKELISTVIPGSPAKPITVVVSSEGVIDESYETEDKKDTIRRCFDALKKKRFEEYESWFKIGCICYNECEEEGLELFDEGSKRGSNYDATSVKVKYEEIIQHPRSEGKIGLGTLIMWAKEDTPSFRSIVRSYYDVPKMKGHYFDAVYSHAVYDLSDLYIADLIIHLYPGYFISDLKTLYFFNEYGIYKRDSGNLAMVIRKIHGHLAELIGCVSSMEDMRDEDGNADKASIEVRIVMMKALIKYLGMSSKQQGIRDALISAPQIKDEKLSEKMDNTNKYVIGFENGVYDIKEKRFRKGRREDYVSMSVGYHWEEPDKEKITKVYEIVRSIWKRDDQVKYYLSMLASCLDGDISRCEVKIHTGEGGNGKSLMFTALSHAIGEYYGVMNPGYFLEEERGRDPGKANPELAQTKGKRIVVVPEVETGKNGKLQSQKLKNISGGEKVMTRNLYGSSFSFVPQYELHLMSNDVPMLSVVDDAIKRRVRVIKYPYKFKSKDEYKEGIEGVYQRREELGSELCELKMSLFHLLIENYDPKYRDTEEIKKDTMEYFEESNQILKWFRGMYENSTNESDYVSLRDITDMYNEETGMKVIPHTVSGSLKRGGYETEKVGHEKRTVYKGVRMRD
jgi:hypothetical protein